MPSMANPFSFVNPKGEKKLSREELLQALRTDIASELEAVQLYKAHANATDDKLVKKQLNAIADEEKDHIGELLGLIRRLDPSTDEHLKAGEKEVKDTESGSMIECGVDVSAASANGKPVRPPRSECAAAKAIRKAMKPVIEELGLKLQYDTKYEYDSSGTGKGEPDFHIRWDMPRVPRGSSDRYGWHPITNLRIDSEVDGKDRKKLAMSVISYRQGSPNTFEDDEYLVRANPDNLDDVLEKLERCVVMLRNAVDNRAPESHAMNEATLRHIRNSTVPPRQRRARYCKVFRMSERHLKRGRQYFFRVRSQEFTERKVHRCNIIMDTTGDAVVTCGCKDFKYRWERALVDDNSARVIHSNGNRAIHTNPESIPGICKHLFAASKYVPRRLWEEARARRSLALLARATGSREEPLPEGYSFAEEMRTANLPPSNAEAALAELRRAINGEKAAPKSE